MAVAGDFSFVKCLNGMVPQQETYEASAAIEKGDIVKFNGSANEITKATASDGSETLLGLAMNDASDGDDVVVMPFVSGVILQGVASAALTTTYLGAEVGLSGTAPQVFDIAETTQNNVIGRIWKIIDSTNKVVQVLIYEPRRVEEAS